jgi:hypothetical protein
MVWIHLYCLLYDYTSDLGMNGKKRITIHPWIYFPRVFTIKSCPERVFVILSEAKNLLIPMYLMILIQPQNTSVPAEFCCPSGRGAAH